METASDTTFRLNYAQVRNLHARQPEEIYTIQVSVPVPDGLPAATVQEVLVALVVRHEALRSRLVDNAAGPPLQLVLDPGRRDALVRPAVRPVAADESIADAIRQDGHRPVDPRTAAMHSVLYVVDDLVRHVVLTVSHLFADGFSQQIIHDDLVELLNGRTPPAMPPRRQASYYSGERLAVLTDAGTGRWRTALRDAPRSCTYAAVRRERTEELRSLTRMLDVDLGPAAANLAASPFMIWAAALSTAVGLWTGQHDHVFRSIAANRFDDDDFAVVADLAQPVFVRVSGSPSDRLTDRLDKVREASLSAHTDGVYDAVDLLSWLDDPVRRRGAEFRPAFDVNYLIHDGAANAASHRDGLESLTQADFAPSRGTADLALQVAQGPVVTARLTAGPPLLRARGISELLADVLTVVRALGQASDQPVGEVAIEPFATVGNRVRTHASGVSIDPAAMRQLLLAGRGVIDADFSTRIGPAGAAVIAAKVRTDGSIERDALLDQYAAAQRWLNGTVVPDELDVICDVLPASH